MAPPDQANSGSSCCCFGSKTEEEDPVVVVVNPETTMAAQASPKPVVAQQPQATQAVSAGQDGALTVTFTEGEDPMQALSSHFGAATTTGQQAAQPRAAAASSSNQGRQPSLPTDGPVTLSFRDDEDPVDTFHAHDSASGRAARAPATRQAQPSSAPDGSIRVVFEEGQDPLQALMQALTAGVTPEQAIEAQEDDDNDEAVTTLLTHYGQDGTAADRSSDTTRARETLYRHASRMAAAPEPPGVPTRQSTLPRRQAGRATREPSAPRRTGSRWTSTRAIPEEGEDAGTTFHALSDDGTGLEVITLADGGMELRLQGHEATEQAEQQLASMVVEDRTTTQAATQDEGTSTSAGAGAGGLRRLESIVGGNEPRDVLGCKCRCVGS